MVNRIIINQNVKLDKNIAWLMGFYFAEGLKNRNSIGIANKETSLLRKSLNIFQDYFNIEKTSWKVYIKSNSRNKKDLAKIKRKWEKSLKLKVKTSYARFAYEQTADVRFNSRIFSKFLKEYFDKIIDNTLSDKDLAKAFLRGYGVGDGSINIRGKQIHNIGITVKNKEYLGYLIKAFTLIFDKKPNIRMTKGSYEVYYCHVNIITKVILAKLFIDSKRQWEKLINGYKNKQYTRSRIKYWNKIRAKPLIATRIAELSGNSHWSVRDALNKDIKLGLVETEFISNKNRGGPPNKYFYLSQSGINLLNLLGG